MGEDSPGSIMSCTVPTKADHDTAGEPKDQQAFPGNFLHYIAADYIKEEDVIIQEDISC